MNNMFAIQNTITQEVLNKLGNNCMVSHNIWERQVRNVVRSNIRPDYSIEEKDSLVNTCIDILLRCSKEITEVHGRH